MLRKGNWEGQQLIASSAVEQTTIDAATPGNGTVGWWSNNDAPSEKLPKDAFWGAGAGHRGRSWREQQRSHKMDERGWPDGLSGFFRRRLCLRAQSDLRSAYKCDKGENFLPLMTS